MYKTKERLVEDFCKLLTANYGYSENQLGLDVNMGRGAVADIAIWKSKEEKEKRSLPDVCVLVNVKSEHIDIEEDDYFSKFKLASFKNIVFFVACNLKEKKVFKMINDGEIRDGKTLVALLWYKSERAAND